MQSSLNYTMWSNQGISGSALSHLYLLLILLATQLQHLQVTIAFITAMHSPQTIKGVYSRYRSVL